MSVSKGAIALLGGRRTYVRTITARKTHQLIGWDSIAPAPGEVVEKTTATTGETSAITGRKNTLLDSY